MARSGGADYSGIFTAKYGELHGKDWIRHVEPEDRAVLVDIGLKATDYGKKGGIARAETAKRDSRGRFARADGTNNVKEPKRWFEES